MLHFNGIPCLDADFVNVSVFAAYRPSAIPADRVPASRDGPHHEIGEGRLILNCDGGRIKIRWRGMCPAAAAALHE